MSTSDPGSIPPEAGAPAADARRGMLRLIRLAMITGAIWIASIGGAELGYRVAGVPLSTAMAGFYEAFGDRGFKHGPHAAAFHNWFSGTFHVYTDENGCRVSSNPAPAPNPAPHILIVGDSQAFGQGLEEEQALFGAFRTTAERAGLTVANTAVGGHFLRNQVELCRWLGDQRRLRPRVLLVALTPRFLANPDAYSNAVVVNGGLFDTQPSKAHLFRKWFSSNSAVYVTARNAIRRFRGGHDPAATALSLYRPFDDPGAITSSLARSISELAGAFGSDRPAIVLCYLPLAVESRIPDLARAAGVEADPSLLARTARAVADAGGYPFIDLSPVLDQARARGGPITLDGDAHYNAQTSAACAVAVWEGLDWTLLAPAGKDAPR